MLVIDTHSIEEYRPEMEPMENRVVRALYCNGNNTIQPGHYKEEMAYALIHVCVIHLPRNDSRQ